MNELLRYDLSLKLILIGLFILFKAWLYNFSDKTYNSLHSSAKDDSFSYILAYFSNNDEF